ncbi:MAG: UDP-N-acetylglucosamine diphosphorylase/glucosamine-1-phosphate N-acetyltransferase [Candidatus Magasanikbacteria bacterium]|nr:UDP-N-acetylglucosamine diphosphorylase/glucosamine-1-phosphate N-acetyltransferase [Candidatus Magasanikbacteria bacterium]
MNGHEHADVGIVILAGGKGKRMQIEDLPKVLVPLYGEPLIKHLLHSIEACVVKSAPIIIIGYKGEMVREALGPHYTYVEQKEQLGTGHALLQARGACEKKYQHVVVLYGDMPHVPADVVDQLVTKHKTSGAVLTMMTATVPDFNDWRVAFSYMGRIVRDANGKILRDVERKDAIEEELEIKEVNPSYYCFRADWLWPNLARLKNNNAQGEYYLTDLLEMAIEQGEKVESISIEPLSALGVNTPEELAIVRKMLYGVLNGNGGMIKMV